MDTVILFLAYSIGILALSMVGAFLPRIRMLSDRQIHLLVALSAGIFVGLLFLLLLPEAFDANIHAYDGHEGINYALYAILAGFLLFIPTYACGLGAVGAGLAMSVGYLFQAIMLVLSVRRYAGISFYGRLWRHLVVAAIDAVVLLAIDHCLGISGFLPLVAVSLFCLAMHFGLSALFREFTRSDAAFFKDALDPKKLSSSMREEMQ